MNNRNRRVTRLVIEGYEYIPCPCCLDTGFLMWATGAGGYHSEVTVDCPLCTYKEEWDLKASDIMNNDEDYWNSYREREMY